MVGRLANDPELRTTQSGKSVCSFPLAVDRKYKHEGQPTADFFKCTAWGRIAEVIDQYMTKGKQIAISGRLQTGSYEKDGVKHYTTDIIVEKMDFIGSKNDQSRSDGGQNVVQGGGGPQYTPSVPQEKAYQRDMLLDDDDFYLLPDDDPDVPF